MTTYDVSVDARYKGNKMVATHSERGPKIHTFAATVRTVDNGRYVVLEWKATNAAFCRISGDDTLYPPVRIGADAVIQTISPSRPLRSSYTLEAVGHDQVTTVRRRITLRFAINADNAPVELDNAVALRCTPDGHKVLVLDAAGVSIFDARTLERLPMGPLTAPDGTGVDAFALAPDGTTVYLISFGGRLYGFDLATLDMLPGSGVYVAAGSEPPYQLAVSHDHTAIAVVTNETYIDNRLVGTNQLQLLHRRTLAPVRPSPVATEHTLVHVIGQRTGRHYLGTPEGLRVLEAATLEEPFAPLDLTLPGMLALSPDEHYLFSVSVDAASRSFVLSKHHAESPHREAQVPIEVGFNPIFMALLGVPFAALLVSPDGGSLIVLGADPDALRRNQIRSSLLLFDAQHLHELAGSPMEFDGATMPIAVTLSPDGSSLFVVAGERIGASDSTSFLLRAHAVWV